MTTTRDDSREKLSHALTLLSQAVETEIQEMRIQHINGAIRFIEMVRDSIEGDSDFRSSIAAQR